MFQGFMDRNQWWNCLTPTIRAGTPSRKMKSVQLVSRSGFRSQVISQYLGGVLFPSGPLFPQLQNGLSNSLPAQVVSRAPRTALAIIVLVSCEGDTVFGQ